MNETVNNLMQCVENHLNNACISFAMLKGYIAGTAAAAEPPKKESLNALFIEFEKYKEIKKVLINLNVKGSVRERAGGLLELRVWIDSKRTSIYGRTEEELLQKFKILRRQRKPRAEANPPEQNTLYCWLDKWVRLYKTDNVKPRTLSAILSCIKVHIKVNFADMPLNRLTALIIAENLKKIESSRMRKYSYQILNEAYKKALQLKLIKENPFALVDVPRHKQQKGTPLTSEEQEEFKIALIGSPYRYYFLFLLYSGCRRCEGLAARWEDIDFARERILIRGTKTELSRSYIPLFDDLAEILKEIRPTETVGLIFPFTEHQVEMAFKKLCPTHHIHDLRHTFATNCIETGVELKAVQAWLRHSNIGITADTYAHATDKFLMQEAEKLKKK